MTAAPTPDNVSVDVPRMVDAGERLLEIKGLKTHFDTREGVVRAVDAVDIHVDRGEVLGIVGESGCGKSVTALSVMGLIAHPGSIVAGDIFFNGKNLTEMKKSEVRNLRGESISMIFQQPATLFRSRYKADAGSENAPDIEFDFK